MRIPSATAPPSSCAATEYRWRSPQRLSSPCWPDLPVRSPRPSAPHDKLRARKSKPGAPTWRRAPPPSSGTSRCVNSRARKRPTISTLSCFPTPRPPASRSPPASCSGAPRRSSNASTGSLTQTARRCLLPSAANTAPRTVTTRRDSFSAGLRNVAHAARSCDAGTGGMRSRAGDRSYGRSRARGSAPARGDGGPSRRAAVRAPTASPAFSTAASSRATQPMPPLP